MDERSGGHSIDLGIADLLPAGVASYEVQDATVPEPLFSEELEVVSRAVAKRKREFALGRMCAHRALSALGVPACGLPMAADRSPVWPSGIVGSITHSGS